MGFKGSSGFPEAGEFTLYSGRLNPSHNPRC